MIELIGFHGWALFLCACLAQNVVMDANDYMRLAIDRARVGIQAGQSPFGAVIIRDDKVVAATHNTVRSSFDPSAHAEVNAIRAAGTSLQTIDFGGCLMYCTCEPCPMCLSAIHWANIDRVEYGATIADATNAGFSELQMPAAELAKIGGSHLVVAQSPLADECRRLFAEWLASGNPPY